jgi:hypothetical protein
LPVCSRELISAPLCVLVTPRTAQQSAAVHPAPAIRHRAVPARLSGGPAVGTTSRTHGQFALHGIDSPTSHDHCPRRLHDAHHRLPTGMDVDVLHSHFCWALAAVAVGRSRARPSACPRGRPDRACGADCMMARRKIALPPTICFARRRQPSAAPPAIWQYHHAIRPAQCIHTCSWRARARMARISSRTLRRPAIASAL